MAVASNARVAITTAYVLAPAGSSWVVRLDGTPRGTDLRELHGACARLRAADGTTPIRVELGAIDGLDGHALRVLRELRRFGVELAWPAQRT